MHTPLLYLMDLRVGVEGRAVGEDTGRTFGSGPRHLGIFPRFQKDTLSIWRFEPRMGYMLGYLLLG